MKTDEMAEMLVAEMRAAIERVEARIKSELRAEFAAMVAESIQFNGSRTLRIGDREFTLNVPIYRGVWDVSATPYNPGDMVTRDGSVWHCNETNRERPGDNSRLWTLAVKKGREGRN